LTQKVTPQVTKVSTLQVGSCWILQYNVEHSLCPESHSSCHWLRRL